MKLLDEMDVLKNGSVTLSEPSAIVSSPDLDELDHQGNEAGWEVWRVTCVMCSASWGRHDMPRLRWMETDST